MPEKKDPKQNQLPAEEALADLVCNFGLMWERRASPTKDAQVKGAAVGFFAGKQTAATTFFVIGLTLSLMMFLFATVVPIWVWLQNYYFYLCMIPVTILTMIGSRFREFPTNVQLRQSVISFAWRTTRSYKSTEIPWNAIVGANSFIMTRNAPSEIDCTYIVLTIDLRRLSEPNLVKKLTTICDTAMLWWHPFPYAVQNDSSHVAFDTDIISIAFPLATLTLESDKVRLISAISQHVSDSLLAPNFKLLSDANHGKSFTMLWLDDINASRRSQTSALEAGTCLNEGRYEVKGQLAAGGQALIYRGLDLTSAELVAIKELVLPVTAGAEVRNRAFQNVKNEALLLGKLDHPGLVKLLDNFVHDHRAYLVLEYLEGRTLRQTVQEDGKLPVATVLSLSTQMCDILNYLHAQSPPVVHRDFTPDNVMMLPDGELKLLDFNVAQQLDSSSTKTVVGKHHYMAPEQFKGKPTSQSDLYSLGCTMYFLLTGEDPVPLSVSHPGTGTDVPQAVDDIVARLTETSLASRYETASAVAEDLKRVVDETSIR